MANKKVKGTKSEKKKMTDFEKMKKNWAIAKKDSTYINPKTGLTEKTPDFIRGKAAAEAERLQRKIDVWNFKQGNTDKIKNEGFLAWLKRKFGGDSE